METKSRRRSSLGRSNLIENCICIFNELIKSGSDLDDISNMVVNNTMPNELRSIAWRIFLGIFDKTKDPYEWVLVSRASRENFNKLSNDKNIEQFIKVIKHEEDLNSLPNGPLLDGFKAAETELQKFKIKYDFFKSQIVSENLLRMYVIWKKDNIELDNTLTKKVCYIMAIVIYSLYPSILHFTTERSEINSKEEINAKSLFYFLNDEEHFDADVYTIFIEIFKKLFNNQEQSTRLSQEEISTIILKNDNLGELRDSKLNKYEKTAYFLLKTANKNLSEHMLLSKIDPYEFVYNWHTSLLAFVIPFENISYFWDNIFLNSRETFEFLDYLIISLINQVSNELLSYEGQKIVEVLTQYPTDKLDLKTILKRALKLQEKVNEV